ncbi:MAG: efflux RND transporter permease subunit [Pseudomonadota bacterium]
MRTVFYREPRLTALVVLVLVSAGLSSLLALGRQEDPTITNLFATVTTSFPGADPARVEALVTDPLEDELRTIAEVSVLNTASATGVSIIRVELSDTVADDAIEGIWSEIRDAVDDAARDFPTGVNPPSFDSDNTGAFAAIVALKGRHAGVPLEIVARLAENLGDQLRSVPGTKRATVFGAPEEEVLVTLDGSRTAALGLTADAVSAAIRNADGKGQAGRVRGSANDLIVDVAGDIDALERVRSVIVREGEAGVTRVADIATVSRGARAPMAEMALVDGSAAILVAARPEEGLQVDAYMARVRAAIEAFAAEAPGGVETKLLFDQSGYTADRLTEVATNMAIGVALVVAVLFLTLGLRAALIVALVLPIVSLATLASMNAIGLAIHQMSVTGLIVALGLLVDAAIVMTDEVGKRIREGASRPDAVGGAVKRLTMPLFASTVTTALAFTPMILLPGPAGDFVGSIAIAVVLMLVWSFIIAITVTPAVSGWFLSGRGAGGGVAAGALGERFRESLAVSLNNPVRSIAVALVLPVLGFLSMPLLTAQFFPGVDRDQFHIEVDLAPGASIGETRGVVDRLDAALQAEAEVASVAWVLGRSAPAFYYNIVGGRESSARYAQALVTTTGPKDTEVLLRRLERSLGAVAPEAQVLVRGLVQGPPVDAPVELRIVGPDLDVLRERAAALRILIADTPTVTVVRDTVVGAAAEVSVAINEAKAERLGLDPGAIARQLEASLEGVTGGTLLEGTEELPVRVRLGDERRADPSALLDLPILPATPVAGGAFPAVPLSAIGAVRVEPSEPIIVRRNGERVNTVQAFVLRDVLPEEALADIRARIDEAGFALPPGYRLEIGGDSDARSDTLGNLFASIGLIVTLTVATIVMTFNSFRLTVVTIVVAVLSAGLSLLALAVFQYPFGINAIIGVIGSIGVSINAAIIIMTGLQADARARTGDRAAMVDVVMGSSRHIVSTTITTFGGFLPLILAGGAFWPPFAMAVAGGVLLSTVVSFYFTPAAFALVYGRRPRVPLGVVAAA